MSSRVVSLAVALVATVAACSSLDRSRDTANPAVPASALATQVCSNCHGVDGNSVSPNFPNLAGQREAYFIAQMNGFKNHGRSDPAGFEYMWGLSKHLTDEQIKGLAAYFAQQKPRPIAGAVVVSSADGKAIYESGITEKNIPACATCHGMKGEGTEAYPSLANQHSDYMVKQLNVFQRTDERPEGSVMKTIAHDMTQENMVAVSDYLQSLPGH